MESLISVSAIIIDFIFFSLLTVCLQLSIEFYIEFYAHLGALGSVMDSHKAHFNGLKMYLRLPDSSKHVQFWMLPRWKSKKDHVEASFVVQSSWAAGFWAAGVVRGAILRQFY